MLPKRHRFHGRAALRRVFQNGVSQRSRIIIAKYTTSAPTRPTRVAVVVSKKIYKSAVKRNRIRRRIFNIVRHDMKQHLQGFDIVLTVISPDALVMTHQQLSLEITKLLSRMRHPDQTQQ